MSNIKTSAKPLEKRALIILLGALAAMGPLSIDMYLPAFPAIERSLHASPGLVSATIATFFVGLCLGQMFYGPISDKIGRRKPLMLGVLVFLVASLGCLLSTSIEALLVFRFLQAFGACSGMVIGRAVIRDLFAPAETSKVFSLVILTMGISPILAPGLGQLIADVSGWRGIFGFMAGFALTVGWAVYRYFPADVAREQPALCSPLWRRFAEVLTDRAFLAYALSGTMVQAGLYAYISGGASLFMGQLGMSPKAFSLLFGLNASGLIIASQWNTRLLRTYSYETILERALKVAAAAAATLTVMGLAHLGGLLIVLPLFVFVACLGMVFPNSTAGALAGQAHQAGTASAVLGAMQYGGAALASAVVAGMQYVTETPVQLTIGVCGAASLLIFHHLVISRRESHTVALAM